MKKQMIFAALAAAAVLATACNRESAPATTKGNAIEFRTILDKGVNSRASLVSQTAHLTNFFVEAGPSGEPSLDFMQTVVWNNSGEWVYAPTKYYPSDGTTIDFFAYAPVKDVNMTNDAELTSDGTAVSFEYTVPNDQSEKNTAVDLLVASVLGKDKDSGEVVFDFYHALSGVTFTAANLNPAGSELVYVVSGIEITALYNEGTFTYPTGYTPFEHSAWEPTTSTLVSYTPGVPESGVALMPVGPIVNYVNLLSANDVMMVIPQAPDTDTSGTEWRINETPGNPDGVSYVKVSFNLKDGSGDFIYDADSFIYLPLPTGFTFEPGMLYNFQFQFEAADAVTFRVDELKDWTTPLQPVTIPEP